MRYLLLLPLALVPWCFAAQSLFTKITDSANPAVNFSNTARRTKGPSGSTWTTTTGLTSLPVNTSCFATTTTAFLPNCLTLAARCWAKTRRGSSWGDLDNDGHPDCVTAGLVSGLHHNNGDNTF